MKTSTVGGALHVAQNGVLVSGALQINAAGQSILFTPSAPLVPGALIQIFFDASATDAAGNTLNAFNSQFTVAQDLTGVAPTVVSISPTNGSSNVALTTVVDIQFSKPIDGSTVTASSVFLKQNDSVSIPATASM